jgi:N-acetylglucosamine kinase-like BadF-type ATPase
MRYSLAILGTASKSQALLVADNGTYIRYERLDEGMEWRDSGYGLPAMIASQLVEKLARYQRLKIPQLLAKCDVVMVAIAGLDEHQAGGRFRNQLADCQIRPESIVFRRLAEVNHAGAFHGSAGVLLRCGHGSSALIKDDAGVVILTGGVGSLAGDQGSGFWIGKKALQAIARARDGRASDDEQSFCRKLLETTVGSSDLSRPFDLIDELRHTILGDLGVKRFLTEFSKSAISLAEGGDDFATRLVHAAFGQLEELIDRPLRACQASLSLPICLRGGVVEASTYFQDGLLHRIRTTIPILHVPHDGQNGHHSDIVGAGLLALNPNYSQMRELSKCQSVFISAVSEHEWSKPKPAKLAHASISMGRG